jgi:uncharacterized HAD superfamily protein
MIIAWDIDDTIGDCITPSLAYFNQKFGTEHTAESVARWVKDGGFDSKKDFFGELYGITGEDITAIYDTEALELYANMPVFQSAIIELNRLVADGHTIIYVTARRESWKQVTEQWLRSAGAPKGDVYYTHKKAELSLELGINRFYEDNIKNVMNLLAIGVECVLVDSLQNEWASPEGVVRVFWNDSHTAIKLSVNGDEVTVA